MNEARIGDWMQTYTGQKFWPADPRAEDIHIEDVAHALARLCRFGGHCLQFFSVAEHCVLMAEHASPEMQLTALMHDASEAYLVDIPRPLKYMLTDYVELEARLEAVIAAKYRLPWPWPPEIKTLDNRILVDERDQNMASCMSEWNLPEPPLGATLCFWEPSEAEARFLQAFRFYSRR